MSTTIGVDLGGTKLLAVRVTDGEVVDERRTSNPGPGGGLTAAVIGAVTELITPDVAAVGAGIAGLVQWPEGIFAWGPHVVGTGVPLRNDLEEAFGLPAVVDNDANAGAYAELTMGSGQGYDHMVLVTLGTGIGGAIVVDGAVYRGSSYAGEWGHTSFEPGGARCACGKRGCWETAASGPALVRLAGEYVAHNPHSSLAQRLGAAPITGEVVTAAADAGDETARGLVAQVGADFGRGLCNLIAVLDPQIVVDGGGLGAVGESLLGPARRTAADALHGGAHRTLPPIVVAALGPSAAAIGAALLAADLAAGRLPLEAAS